MHALAQDVAHVLFLHFSANGADNGKKFRFFGSDNGASFEAHFSSLPSRLEQPLAAAQHVHLVWKALAMPLIT